ncbi:adhesion G protein-coupled receptor F4 [Danio aesculapii]|uniref:adhesion G protein-coupled receptor F4 n=1 Tax=Danio aesculapii TaxID=1142201 RepID=UPI0024BFE155|nr:adhesion G protein-coupled receptor F4 [Danio aesculapii]
MAIGGKTLKFLFGAMIAVLLIYECAAEALNFSEISVDLQFSDGPAHHIRRRSTGMLLKYGSGIDVSVFDFAMVNNITSIPLPYALSSINILEVDMTTVIGMSLKMSQTFDTNLADPNNPTFKDLSGKLESSIDSSYSTYLKGYISKSVKVNAFRPGSVLADYTISATSNNLDFSTANADLSSSLQAQGIILPADAFAQSDQKDFTMGQVYPLQKLDLKCTQPDFVKGQITWRVNNKDPALDNTTYSLSSDNSTLTVKNITETDSGQYSCFIERTTIPYIQWQNIVIKQRPTINVGNDYRLLPCDGSSFLLKCSVDAGYNIEWVQGETVQDSENGPDGITLNYTTPSENCTEETFTCRLKGLPQLLAYSYSQSRVTVKNTDQSYDCLNEELGIGNITNESIGFCPTGTKGIIIYRCDLNGWTAIEENCILAVISDLLSLIQTLQVEQIQDFMANLSFAAEQNTIIITQSAAIVRAIVDILFKIADLVQAIFIGQPVMKISCFSFNFPEFPKIVDIALSNEAIETWKKLNNGNTTANTNIRLLNAIENISERLINMFQINQTYIQLIRTLVSNSFSVTSILPNSTTEIVIPQLPEMTTATILIFTTLDKILPTRKISNYNSSRESDQLINGDVVVVKVDKQVNNISFAFGITNQSLGNPQCVFWNFHLDAWDSTGCEVKQVGNDSGIITCECNHTTSFSILMSPFDIDRLVLAYITYIGVSISMASLILCLIIEAIVWKSVTSTRGVRNDTSYIRHVSLVNIAMSLLIANICFFIEAAISDEDMPTHADRCSPVVFFMHFFYLALFFWMLISGMLLLYMIVMVFFHLSIIIMMIIAFTVGYGAPLLIAAITVASTAGAQNYVSKQACWLNWDESRALLAFVIPALTIVAINLVVLVVVLYKMLRRGVVGATQTDEKRTFFVVVRCVAFLTPLFGLTWGFGIGTMVSRKLGVHVVFTLLNSFQGLFVLLFGTILDSKVRESLRGKLLLEKITSRFTKSTSEGASSSARQETPQRNVNNVPDSHNSSRLASVGTNGSYSDVDTQL